MDIGPGSLVECIDDGQRYPNSPGFWPGGEIQRGHIYEVEGAAGLGWVGGEQTIHLVRVRDGENPRVGFAISRFRPVDDGRIEIFRRLVANLDGELVA